MPPLYPTNWELVGVGPVVTAQITRANSKGFEPWLIFEAPTEIKGKMHDHYQIPVRNVKPSTQFKGMTCEATDPRTKRTVQLLLLDSNHNDDEPARKEHEAENARHMKLFFDALVKEHERKATRYTKETLDAKEPSSDPDESLRQRDTNQSVEMAQSVSKLSLDDENDPLVYLDENLIPRKKDGSYWDDHQDDWEGYESYEDDYPVNPTDGDLYCEDGVIFKFCGTCGRGHPI